MRNVYTTVVFTLFVQLLFAQIQSNPCAEDIQLFPSSYCYPDSIQFFSYPVPDSGKTVIYKVNNDTISTFDSLGILNPGIYSLIVITSTDTCWYSDTTSVHIIQAPTPQITENYITNLEVEFISGGPYDSFFWKVNNVLLSIDSTLTHTFQNDSTYEICLGVYLNGCYTDTCYFIGFGGSVGLAQAEEIQFNLFPNPASDRIHIQSDRQPIREVEITDISGHAVYSESFHDRKSVDLNIGDLSTGIYIVRINRDVFRRVVVQ